MLLLMAASVASRSTAEEPCEPPESSANGPLDARQSSREAIRGVALCEKQSVLQDAQAAEAKGDYRAAQELYASYLQAHPGDPAVMRKLAHAVFFQGKAQEAYDELKKAYSIGPRKRERPDFELAKLYAEIGDIRQAEVWMDFAIKNGADETLARLMLARLALGSGEVDWALQQADWLAKKDQGSREAKLLRADELPACVRQARWAVEHWSPEIALRQAEKILALRPTSVDARVVQGQVALYLKDYKTAQRCFEIAASQSAEDRAVRNGLALALCEQDDKPARAKALPLSKANFEKYPKDVEATITHARRPLPAWPPRRGRQGGRWY